MNSDKLLDKGFIPKANYKKAVDDILYKFYSGFKPSEKNWNLKWLLKKNIIKKS
jgi:hypothetical protein